MLEKRRDPAADLPAGHPFEGEKLIEADDRPENDAVRAFAGLVAEELLCAVSGWPTAEQLKEVEGVFGYAPARALGAALVVPITRKSDHRYEQTVAEDNFPRDGLRELIERDRGEEKAGEKYDVPFQVCYFVL